MRTMEYLPIRDEDKKPICPYCEKEIEDMRYFEQAGTIKMKVVRLFVCPH